MIERKKLVKNDLKEIFTEKWVHGPFLASVSCEFFKYRLWEGILMNENENNNGISGMTRHKEDKRR